MHHIRLCIGCAICLKQKRKSLIFNDLRSKSSDSDRIQTCNLLIRSQMLYSVELRSRYAAKLLFVLVVVLCSDLLFLDTSLLTRKFSEVEDTSAANFTDFVELD